MLSQLGVTIVTKLIETATVACWGKKINQVTQNRAEASHGDRLGGFEGT